MWRAGRKKIFDDSSEETETKFSKGEISGDTYHNEFFDITFNLPEGWSFKSDDEIKEMMGNAAEMLDSEEFDKATEGEIICFMAATSDGSENINLSVKKGGILVSEKASMDASTELISEQYEQMGAEVTVGEVYENKMGKNSFLAADIIVKLNGVELHQTFNLKTFGRYLATVSLTTGLGEDPAEFCKYFE